MHSLIKLSLIMTLLFAYGCGGKDDHSGHDHAAEAAADDHSGHDHAAEAAADDHSGHDHAAEPATDDHSGHDHGVEEPSAGDDPHAGHDHGSEAAGAGVTLNADAQRIAGITLGEVAWKRLSHTVELPGRIGFNEDKLVHITPRFGGVIRELNVTVGARVEAGDALAVLENNETMALYTVTAPISGRIIEKHASLGESVGDDSPIFILADLSRVWVNCDAYPADISLLKQGMKVQIHTVGGERTADAHISYIAPVFNPSSSTGLVRMTLFNGSLQWRPGMFVRARILIPGQKEIPCVHPDAVQVIAGEDVVFVPGPAGSFFSRVVKTGMRSPEGIQIKRGLGPGETYVVGGAYGIKATMVTSGMDPHAGHGH